MRCGLSIAGMDRAMLLWTMPLDGGVRSIGREMESRMECVVNGDQHFFWLETTSEFNISLLHSY